MKLKNVAPTVIMLGAFMSNSTFAHEPDLRIRTLFNIKSSFCSIRTNGVVGIDNRKSAYRGIGSGISSTNSLLLLENGENEISLEMAPLWRFSDEKTPVSKKVFNHDAGCKLSLVRFEHQKETVLSSIEVILSKDGLPVISDGNRKDIIFTKVFDEQVIPGHIDPEYFDPAYYPSGMELYKFSQKITITGIPEWKWTTATPYSGEKEQLYKLQLAYNKIAEAINNKDRDYLKNSHSISLHAWALTTGDTEDEILDSQYPKSRIEMGNIKIEPIKWDDYSVRVLSKGRIVQLYNKSKPTFSPLTYYFTNEEGNKVMGYFAPLFSLIDGKFVVVI